MASRVLEWLRLGRPHFLIGGFAFFALGALLAADRGLPLGILDYVVGQAFVTLVQAGVHYGNEWHDLAADRANLTRTRFAGGSRVLAESRLPAPIARLSSQTAFAGAFVALAGAGALAGWHAVALGCAILILSWGYSAPPLRLHSRGIGGIVVGTILSVLVPAFALALADANLDQRAAFAVAPLVLDVAALVGVLSLPDLAGDTIAGKRTLAVRIGARHAGRVFQAAWICAGLMAIASVFTTQAAYSAVPGWAALTLATAFPILAGLRRWDFLAVCAAALVALQWFVTVLSLV